MTGQKKYRNRMTHWKVSFQYFSRGNYIDTADIERESPSQSRTSRLSTTFGKRHATMIFEDQQGMFVSVEPPWVLH
jgi:hypothetical protein